MLLAALMAVTGALKASGAEPPRIDLIELFVSDGVLIHFEAEANRTYELQYTESLPTAGLPAPSWKRLFTTINLPFPNHYVYPDKRTAARRFYRLLATP